MGVIVAREVRSVYFVDGARTPFGKAGKKGIFAETRADDLVVNVFRELLRRNTELPPERIDDVAVAATTQTGDQGLTIGRSAALLSGLPRSVPGYSVDRMCAGAMTSVTSLSAPIMAGLYDVALAGGVEHMGRHPMGEGVDPNPRFLAEKLVDPEALLMGKTAENLHDRFPHLTKERADAYAVASQEKTGKAYANGKIQPMLVPVATRSAEGGFGLATTDEPPRPGTSMESLAGLKTPFRPHGRVTAGNAAGLNDGATAAILAAGDVADDTTVRVPGATDASAAGGRTTTSLSSTCAGGAFAFGSCGGRAAFAASTSIPRFRIPLEMMSLSFGSFSINELVNGVRSRMAQIISKSCNRFTIASSSKIWSVKTTISVCSEINDQSAPVRALF